MSYEMIVVETRDRVGLVTINRPKQLNALNDQVMNEIGSALLAFDADERIGAIVITGSEKAFAAGADIGAMAEWGYMDVYKSEYITRNWEAIRRVRKPVIAAVAGFALGGGCELAMMCCITFASETARFGEPEIRFANSPPAVIMPWIIGLKRARELLYTGDTIDAEEALRAGMVNRVFPDDALKRETWRYARRAAAIALEGLQTTKASINRGAEIAGLRQAIDYGVEAGAALDATATETNQKFEEIRAREGLSAAIRWRESQFE